MGDKQEYFTILSMIMVIPMFMIILRFMITVMVKMEFMGIVRIGIRIKIKKVNEESRWSPLYSVTNVLMTL